MSDTASAAPGNRSDAAPDATPGTQPDTASGTAADAGRIVILGGHGKVALLAAPRLRAAGFSVDAVIRNADHASDVRKAGANPVILDMESASAADLAKEFAGAKAVVFSAGAGGGNPERTHAVDYEAAVRAMGVAQSAGVQRFVMVSYASAGIDVDRLEESNSFYPYAKAKHDADAHLRTTDLDYTILGPGRLTLDPASEKIQIVNAYGVVDGQEVPAEARVTSRDNVAAVIAHVLKSGAAIRETVNFYDGDTPIVEAIS